MDIVDCDEGPDQVVDVADASEPCGFGGKTSSGVEIPDCALDAGKLMPWWAPLWCIWAILLSGRPVDGCACVPSELPLNQESNCGHC